MNTEYCVVVFLPRIYFACFSVEIGRVRKSYPAEIRVEIAIFGED